MTDPILTTLTATRQRLTPPDSWIQHQYALDRRGRPVNYDNPDAVCWCVKGAVYSTDKTATEDLAKKTRLYLESFIGPLQSWNDVPGRTHRQVLNMLDSAIERCANG